MSQFIEMFHNGCFPHYKLRDFIQVQRGVSYKPADVRTDLDEGSCIILRSNNIDGGEINFNDLVFVDSQRVSSSQIVTKGDIIMCASNGSRLLVGKAALIKKECQNTSFGAFCLGIRCNENILPQFLAIYFQTSLYRDEIESLSSGSNILNIKPDHIYNIEIEVPPVKEQMQFVRIAEQADKSKFVYQCACNNYE